MIPPTLDPDILDRVIITVLVSLITSGLILLMIGATQP